MTDTMRLDTAKLARLRRRAGLSYRQLAGRCGISHVQLSRLESGASQPQPSTLLAIARALGVDDPNDLLEEQAAAGIMADITWDCGAYGPEGAAAGALCFIAEPGKRVCASLAECHLVMGAERQRAFRRINELAAAGDPDMARLVKVFTSPEQLLGGGGEEDTDG